MRIYFTVNGVTYWLQPADDGRYGYVQIFGDYGEYYYGPEEEVGEYMAVL